MVDFIFLYLEMEYTAILLPVNSKAKCRACGQSDSVTGKLEGEVCEKCASLLGVESLTVDKPDRGDSEVTQKEQQEVS